MIEFDLAEFSCPLPENKSREFFGVDFVSQKMTHIVELFCGEVGRVAKKVKSNEDLSNLSEMIFKMLARDGRVRAECILDQRLGGDERKKELAKMMGILLTKNEESFELVNENTAEVLSSLQNCTLDEKIVLKNFVLRMNLNWLDRIKERQNEIKFNDDLFDDLTRSFGVMEIENRIPSTSIKRERFEAREFSRLIDDNPDCETQTQEQNSGQRKKSRLAGREV